MAALILASEDQREKAQKAVTALRKISKAKGSTFRFINVYKSYNKRTKALRVKIYMVFGWSAVTEKEKTKIAKLGFEYNAGDLLAYF